MAVKFKKISTNKKNIIRTINRRLSEYEKKGFDDAKIYNDFVIALKRTKGITVVRRPNNTFYISQKDATIEITKLNKLATFQTLASQIKKYGGKEAYRQHIDNQNFIDEYINEIGYDVGVELFDEFGKNLQDGLKNHYTSKELEAKISQLRKEKENLREVNPFG